MRDGTVNFIYAFQHRNALSDILGSKCQPMKGKTEWYLFSQTNIQSNLILFRVTCVLTRIS